MTDQKSIIVGLAPPKYGTFLYLDLARRIKTETQGQKLLLLYYASRAKTDGSFCVGLDVITAETGLSRATVGRGNADFKWVGILDWVKGFGNRFTGTEGKANTYQFNQMAFMRLPFVAVVAPQPKRVARVKTGVKNHRPALR
jgi:hypothetical protein